MHEVFRRHLQICWIKVVLSSWKCLHDVASLSTDIQVMDEIIGNISWSSIHFEYVGTILVGRVDIL